MREMRRETEVPEARVPVVECVDGVARISSKGTCTTPFCEKWHPPECLFYKSESGCRFGEKCSYAHRQVEEQPSIRFKKNGDKSAVAVFKGTRQLGCVFQDMEPPKSTTVLRKSRRTSCSHTRPKSIAWMICSGDPHRRNPNAPKF